MPGPATIDSALRCIARVWLDTRLLAGSRSSKPHGGLNEFTGKSALGLSSVGRRRIGLDRGERRRICLATHDSDFTL